MSKYIKITYNICSNPANDLNPRGLPSTKKEHDSINLFMSNFQSNVIKYPKFKKMPKMPP